MSRLPERDHRALAMRASGATLQQIGDELGVTRERSRQILSQAAHRRIALDLGPRHSPQSFYYEERFGDFSAERAHAILLHQDDPKTRRLRRLTG